MAKLTLDSTYIHTGNRYGPGNVEVPDAIVNDLKAAMKRRQDHLRKQDREQQAINPPTQAEKDREEAEAKAVAEQQADALKSAPKAEGKG